MACNFELNKNSDWVLWPIFNVLALTVHGPLHRPFDAVQLSCPLNRKTPPKQYVSTSMFDGRLVTVPFTAKQLTLLRHRKYKKHGQNSPSAIISGSTVTLRIYDNTYAIWRVSAGRKLHTLFCVSRATRTHRTNVEDVSVRCGWHRTASSGYSPKCCYADAEETNCE